MARITDRVVARLRRVRPNRGGHPTAPRVDDAGREDRQIVQLRNRVSELEAEMLETRQQARRIAELTDVVEQLLLTEELRDVRRIEERLGQRRARS
jgi:hypothetical protein